VRESESDRKRLRIPAEEEIDHTATCHSARIIILTSGETTVELTKILALLRRMPMR
jgi:hypothetical protein